jgi:hypothetical protein
MKILKVLKEQEETPNNLQVVDGGTYGYVKEMLDKIEAKIKEEGWRFSTETFPSPDGSYRCNTTLYVNRSSETELNLSGKIYLMLKQPQIPLDFLSVTATWMVDKFKTLTPDLPELVMDGRYKEGSITFNFKDIFIAYKDTFLSLYDYMNRAYYNTHVSNVIPIEELMTEKSIDFNYRLEEPQVPKFSDDYSLATDKMIKKVMSVYKGFRKGTFRGHQYEYVRQDPQISIHLRNETYDQTTKVIHPKFKVSINAGYPHIDGKATSDFQLDSDKFTDENLIDEFNKYIKARFEQFGIKIL